jgi:hypothetical protein
MTAAAVFLVSAAALGYEILLVRVFAIAQWNHLAFMVISIALVGFAVSGTYYSLYSLVSAHFPAFARRVTAVEAYGRLALLLSLSMAVGLVFILKVPLDYFRLPFEPGQWVYLFGAYVIMALPFFFTGLIIVIAYVSRPETTGWIYAANMMGSAGGAMLPLALLFFMEEAQALVWVSLIPLLVILFPAGAKTSIAPGDPPRAHQPRWVLKSVAGLWLLAVLVSLMAGGPEWLRVSPTPYKGLSQVLMLPQTRIVHTESGIRGRIDRVVGPHIRFAPGLSLKYQGDLPLQWAVYTDGDGRRVFYDGLDAKTARFARFSHLYAGYLLHPEPQDVLVIQENGGFAVACAIASGAPWITVLDADPRIAVWVREHYGVAVSSQPPNRFFTTTRNRFDLIHLENWGNSLPGTAALDQQHCLTRESITRYLSALSEEGVFMVSRMLHLPPSDMPRLWATVYESLLGIGVEQPQRHMVIIRNWDSFSLIVTPRHVPDTGVIATFARKHNFDLVAGPDIELDLVNRYNVFQEAFHHREIQRLADAYTSGSQGRYFRNYPLDVAPQTDDRPFPNRFFKWSRFKDIYGMSGSRTGFLALSGEIIVGAVLVTAVGVSILLLLLPLGVATGSQKRPGAGLVTYFLAVGAGFMFMELYFIKLYFQLWSSPAISLSVVLAGLLVSTGLGGIVSQKIDATRFPLVMTAVLIVLAVIYFAYGPLIKEIGRGGAEGRLPGALLLLLPPGLLMGIPFPLGMRHMSKRPLVRAYAWTANGCASVVAAVIAAQIALSVGISAMAACAVMFYIVAFYCGFRQLSESKK